MSWRDYEPPKAVPEVWTAEQARETIAAYPDDRELWRKAVEWSAQQAAEGATGEYVDSCLQVLEQEWERMRRQQP